MGGHRQTSFVNSENIDGIVTCLRELFSQEGYELDENRSPPKGKDYTPACRRDVWTVQVFPGRSGWSVITSEPRNLMGLSALHIPKPRIAIIASIFGRPAVYSSMDDGEYYFIIETDKAGKVLSHGWTWGEEEFAELAIEFHEPVALPEVSRDEDKPFDISMLPKRPKDQFVLLPELNDLVGNVDITGFDGESAIHEALAGTDEYLLPSDPQIDGLRTLVFVRGDA